MGRHADEERGRGFAGWLIGSGVAVLVAAIVVVGYIVLMHRADSAEQALCSGHVTLHVVAGPASAPAITDAAGAYNATKPVVRSSCVTASVTALPDNAALARLSAGWPTKTEPPPGLWVPDSVASLAALDAVRPDLAAGHATAPLAWSPVVLAMRSADAAATGPLRWSELATTSGPSGTATLPSGRHLILALPPVVTSPASSYALQSVLAGADPSKPVDAATITGRAALLRTIAAGHGGHASTTTEALTDLAATPSDATGATGAQDLANTVTAVPVVEVDLVRFDTQAVGGTLTAVHPAGATVGDALIAAPISAAWTDRTATAAGSDFQAFLASVPGQQILANHGWRAVSAHPAHPLPEVDTETPITMVPAGGPQTDQALAVALGEVAPPPSTGTAPTSAGSSTRPPTATTTPPATTTKNTAKTTPSAAAATTPGVSDAAATGPVLTVIVDTSAGMADKDAGTSLIDWVRKALPAVVGGKVTNRVGLWAYSDGAIYPPTGFPQLVPTGPLTQQISITLPGAAAPTTVVRSTALTDALASLRPAGDRWAYGALMEALPKIAKEGVAGRGNRVILITSGTDQTPGTPRSMVLNSVRAVKGTVRLDVIGLGPAVPVAAYSEIAAASGGTYLPATDPTTLGQQMVDLLAAGG